MASDRRLREYFAILLAILNVAQPLLGVTFHVGLSAPLCFFVCNS